MPMMGQPIATGSQSMGSTDPYVHTPHLLQVDVRSKPPPQERVEDPLPGSNVRQVNKNPLLQPPEHREVQLPGQIGGS